MTVEILVYISAGCGLLIASYAIGFLALDLHAASHNQFMTGRDDRARTMTWLVYTLMGLCIAVGLIAVRMFLRVAQLASM